ncbi:MAG: hypothetical protein LBL96_04430, partial [Clostridiales bacterium]|nr:hypothetical protein [Clostridiales bacterium]
NSQPIRSNCFRRGAQSESAGISAFVGDGVLDVPFPSPDIPRFPFDVSLPSLSETKIIMYMWFGIIT